MRRTIPAIWTLALMVAAGAVATGQEAATKPAGARVLGTHLIDRYEAIQQVRAGLRSNPNNLNDWIILGELAQEVAGEVPADMAPGYYKLAHDAYENALKLSPNNASLKAAAAFTREQEQKA